VHTIGSTLQAATEYLKATHDTARLDAEILLGHVLGKPRSFLYAWPEHALTDNQATAFEALVSRRARGEPVAHLTGHREFWSFTLEVSRHVLIPRPETEHLVELALECIPREASWRIADLGTGSSAIALAIASERPRCMVVATERSAPAMALARRNARRLGTGNLGFVQTDWCSALASGSCHMVVSNPPYVAPGDPHLVTGDVRFEPREALVGGEQGLDAIRAIAGDARRCLRRGGWLLLEHGYTQGKAVRSLLSELGYATVGTVRDLGGRERATRARVA